MSAAGGAIEMCDAASRVAPESVRCNARSGEQHEHRRKTRWARKEGEALRSLQSALVRVPEAGLTERGGDVQLQPLV